jgi:hypothetical protein
MRGNDSTSSSLRNVRREVDKMLKKHGIGRSHDHEETDGDESLEPETLSALRYELVKMQQELMRRKVLDSRYYNAISVDTLFPKRDDESKKIAISNQTSDKVLTQIEIISKDKKSKAPTRPYDAKLSRFDANLNADQQVSLFESSGLFYNNHKGVAEIVLDYNENTVIGKIHHFLDSDSLESESASKRHTVAYSRASSLLLNRMTGSTIEKLKLASRSDRIEVGLGLEIGFV